MNRQACVPAKTYPRGGSMVCRANVLRYKEVINVGDGLRLGFVCDVDIDLDTGQVTALIVPGPRRFFGLFGREPDYVIPWDSVTRIGDDIIIIDMRSGQIRGRREKERRVSPFPHPQQ